MPITEAASKHCPGWALSARQGGDMKKPIEDYFLWRLLVRLERFILVAVSVMAMLCVVAGALMRYIFKIDLYGIEEIIILLAMWLYFIGGAYGSYENSHISADMVSNYIKSNKVKRYIRIFVALVTVVCAFILSRWSLQYIAFALKIQDRSISLHIPMLFFRIPIALCFILSFFYGIYHLVNAILDRQPLILDRGSGSC